MTSLGDRRRKERDNITGGDVTRQGVTPQERRRKMMLQWVTSQGWHCGAEGRCLRCGKLRIGNYIAANYVAGNYVVEVCGSLRPRHVFTVTRTQVSAHLHYVIRRSLLPFFSPTVGECGLPSSHPFVFSINPSNTPVNCAMTSAVPCLKQKNKNMK